MRVSILPGKVGSVGVLLACLIMIGPLSISFARAQEPGKQWVEKATVASPVSGQKRLALVLGNTHYGEQNDLKNPENDARAIATALSELGFESTIVLDGTLEQMSDALHAFTAAIRAAGSQSVAMLYYSGHGVQLNGENYLIPVGFKMPSNERDMVRYALSAQSALEEMQQANAQINIAILDACRDNPFAKNRSLGNRGLAKLETQGVLIAYATAPGTTASDNGNGKNGLYTTALLKYLHTPGLTLNAIFSRTRKAVYEASQKKQIPYTTDGLIDGDDFCLLPTRNAAPDAVLVPPKTDTKVPPLNPIKTTPVIASPVVVPPATPQKFSPPLTLAEYKAQMVTIPAGEFTMGDADSGEHTVMLSAYKIGLTTVTVGMWEEFCTATGRERPEAPEFNSGWAKKTHPIVNVTWEDAQAYCKWGGLKLPTEAQWEKAARGTDRRNYPWGVEFDASKLWCSVKNYGDAGGTHSVGSFTAGASPYGCLDMAGNVYQWCEDRYDQDFYASRQATEPDPVNPAVWGLAQVCRGCAYTVPALYKVQFKCSYRGMFQHRDKIFDFLGFRCVSP